MELAKQETTPSFRVNKKNCVSTVENGAQLHTKHKLAVKCSRIMNWTSLDHECVKKKLRETIPCYFLVKIYLFYKRSHNRRQYRPTVKTLLFSLNLHYKRLNASRLLFCVFFMVWEHDKQTRNRFFFTLCIGKDQSWCMALMHVRTTKPY